MTQAPTITTVFLDVGSVLLTDSWGPSMRQKALEHFSFDFAEVADRSRLTFEGYEEGNISLEEYLDWVVFYQERPFSRKAIIDFMLAQSQPYPEMLELMRTLKARYGCKIVVVTNDGREFATHRIRQFGLAEFVDFFIVSSFVHCRKPEPDIYRLALDLSQTPPARTVFIDDQLLFVEVAQKLGMHGIHHTGYDSTKAALETLGFSLTL